MIRAILLLSVVVSGCKKKPPEDDGSSTDGTLDPSASVDSRLSIVSVSPSRVDPETPTSVRVFGAGFERGITVSIGDTPATSATFVNENQLDVGLPALAAGSWDVRVTNPDDSQNTLRGGLQVGAPLDGRGGEACDFVVLYFETAEDALNAAAQSTLTSLVPCYQGAAVPVNVSGHADVRGTTDYNVALAYRRALSVRDYLVGAGIAPGKLLVTSFGEERPADPGPGPEAWAKNRRVELSFD
jgi:outer membrane protein OmpA-like peptidoglycan-associated protein